MKWVGTWTVVILRIAAFMTKVAFVMWLQMQIRWTFPLAFAEVISGDGREVYRERIDLTDTAAHGTRVLRWQPKLAGRRWVRLEVWDVAAEQRLLLPLEGANLESHRVGSTASRCVRRSRD